MNDARHDGPHHGIGRPARVAALAGVALLLAGCGGSSSPGVAKLKTTTPSGANSGTGADSTLFPADVAGSGGSMSTQVGTGRAAVKFSDCMRAHGVPRFPDPNAQGTLTITVSPALDPSSPLFQKAESDCGHLLPPAKGLSLAMQRRLKKGLLAFAACMRSHGLANYPDPKFGPGGMVSQGTSRSSGIDPNSPTYQAAQKACQSKHPS
jgi:hypothetical protein